MPGYPFRHTPKIIITLDSVASDIALLAALCYRLVGRWIVNSTISSTPLTRMKCFLVLRKDTVNETLLQTVEFLVLPWIKLLYLHYFALTLLSSLWLLLVIKTLRFTGLGVVFVLLLLLVVFLALETYHNPFAIVAANLGRFSSSPRAEHSWWWSTAAVPFFALIVHNDSITAYCVTINTGDSLSLLLVHVRLTSWGSRPNETLQGRLILQHKFII